MTSRRYKKVKGVFVLYGKMHIIETLLLHTLEEEEVLEWKEIMK
jgi:hypothetical protein